MTIAALTFQSGAFTTVQGGRNAEIGAAKDSNALIGLEVYSVTAGNESKLVTVENNLNQQVTIDIELTQGPDGQLAVESGDNSGSSVMFSLMPGKKKTVYLTVTGNEDYSCSTSSTSKTTNSYRVTFQRCSYDSSSDKTTYTYKVEGIGKDSGEYHDLSHIVFGVSDGFDTGDVVSSNPQYSELMFHKADPTTGVSGIKWDEDKTDVDKEDGRQIYTYTLDGKRGTTTVDVGLKAGPESEIVRLPGPSTLTSSSSHIVGQTVTFELTASNTVSEVTLQRSTTVVSSGDGGDESGSSTSDDSSDDSDSDKSSEGDNHSDESSDNSKDEDKNGKRKDEEKKKDQETMISGL